MTSKKWANEPRLLLFAGGMLLGLTFLLLVPREAAGRLQLLYAQVFRWPLTLGGGVVVISQTTAQRRYVSPQEHEKLRRDYQQLRNGYANLQMQLQDTNRRLGLLTKLRAQPGLSHLEPIPAVIIMQVQEELTIGAGRDLGVAVGQYVLSLTDARPNEQCVIGVVCAVDAKGARVRLLTDSASRQAVYLAGLDAPRVMEGQGNGTAKIPFVPCTHEIHAGDPVYAEAQRGRLDVPIIAGEVAQCARDADNPLVWDITVRPACDLATLTDVAVMRPASVP
jgi:cell shape-determining protein MreC